MSDEDKRIHEWRRTKQQRGRPSCPCGFVGGGRNIVSHRLACPTWRRYAEICRRENA